MNGHQHGLTRRGLLQAGGATATALAASSVFGPMSAAAKTIVRSALVGRERNGVFFS
jgi:hypothetical protein